MFAAARQVGCIGRGLSSLAASGFRNPTIAVIPGSSRKGSINLKLAQATQGLLEAHDVTTNMIDLGALNLPLYNQDLEADGIPSAVADLKQQLESCDGLLVVTPESAARVADNGFITPLLLNAFTWSSRFDDPSGPMYASFKGKVAAVLSASPGALGGMRAHGPTRSVLQNLGVTVVPASAAVGGAFKAFGENGELVDERQLAMAEATVAALVKEARMAANYDATCTVVRSLMDTPQPGEYGMVTSS